VHTTCHHQKGGECWNLYFDDNNCDADALELYLKKLMLSSNCSRLLKDIGYFCVFFIEC